MLRRTGVKYVATGGSLAAYINQRRSGRIDVTMTWKMVMSRVNGKSACCRVQVTRSDVNGGGALLLQSVAELFGRLELDCLTLRQPLLLHHQLGCNGRHQALNFIFLAVDECCSLINWLHGNLPETSTVCQLHSRASSEQYTSTMGYAFALAAVERRDECILIKMNLPIILDNLVLIASLYSYSLSSLQVLVGSKKTGTRFQTT